MVVGDAYVSWLSHTSTNRTFLSKATDYFFPHASAEVRGQNTPERKVASTWDRTQNGEGNGLKFSQTYVIRDAFNVVVD